MDGSVAEKLSGVHPKMLRVGTGSVAKPDRKKLADLRPVVGRRVERTFELMGITKQDAAFRMGYSDAGTVSRWCSGTERPHLDKLFQLDGFEQAWLLASAEHNAPTMEVETIVKLRRPA